MIGGEITAPADNTEPVPSFLDFAETDLAFGEPIPIARPVIRFFVVCPNGRAALEHLVRKCNGDGVLGCAGIPPVGRLRTRTETNARANRTVCSEGANHR